MTIRTAWIVFDTNVWIFGLRDAPERPACFQLLRRLPHLLVHVPRQILLELRANLRKDELDDLFDLLNRYPERVVVSWSKVQPVLIRKYQQLGCKLGDATVAAHVETLQAEGLISENRDFLTEIKGLPFQVLRAEEALRELDTAD